MFADDRGSARPGASHGAGHTEAQVRCAPGSLLLLNTDGFTDVAGEDAEERADLLERTVAALPPRVSAEEVVERVVNVCLPGELRDGSRCWWSASPDRTTADAGHSRIAEHRSA